MGMFDFLGEPSFVKGYVDAQNADTARKDKDESDRRSSLADTYYRLSSDESNFTPEQRNMFLNAYAGINNTPRHKKLSKEHENALSAALSIPRTYNGQQVSGVRTPQEISGAKLDAYRSETSAKNDIQWAEMQRRAKQFQTEYGLDPQQALEMATEHNLPSPHGANIQVKWATVRGSSTPRPFNFNPVSGTWTDPSNGQPVDPSQLTQLHTENKGQIRPMQRRDGSYGWGSYDPITRTFTEIDTDLGPAMGLDPVMDPASGTVTYSTRGSAVGQITPGTPTAYDYTGQGTTAGQPWTKQPPPTPSAAIQEQLAGWEVTNQLANEVLDSIKTTSASIGPGMGRLATLELQYLGGYGTTPEEKKLAADLNNLLTQRAFSDGGKQLTGIELERFTKMLPQMSDTVESAITKVSQAIHYANTVREAKYTNVPFRQREQLKKPTPAVVAKPFMPTSVAAPPASKPIVQHSKSTGMYRWSYDGGTTWQTGSTPPR